MEIKEYDFLSIWKARKEGWSEKDWNELVLYAVP